MDGDRRSELERWADALARSDVAELRAAGRAIRTLCEENGALEARLERVEREHARAGARADDEPEASPRRRRPHVPWGGVLLALGFMVVLAASLAIAARAAQPELVVTGPEPGAVIGRDALPEVSFTAAATDAEWLLDGRRVTPRREGARTVWRPSGLAEGTHEVVVRRRGRLFSSARRVFRFTVDTKPPVLELAAPATVRRGKPLELRGTLEPGAVLRSGDRAATAGARGAFRLLVRQPPPQLVFTATDVAGNRSRWRIPVTVVPLRPAEPIRAVHVTAYAWADKDLRRGILDLVRSKRINAVELDLKDEAGEVGWESGVPLAKRIGAQLDIYDLAAAVKQLHGLGVRVIGRLVCFRDPIHATAAWRAGRKGEVIQAPDGTPYAKYGGFTNFASPAVRKYNVDLAVAAAKLGVDEILYDYVRRPDGPLASMVFPGLRRTPEQAIVEFLADGRAALAPFDVLVGASVFGVAATRPEEVAQDIPAMARQVDYIAPMLYPSHWGPGEYDVADPNGQPYDIVLRSTRDFVEQVRGTGARVVNWLQDFSYGRTYGAAEVRAQIEASQKAGVDDFLLWDAAVSYTEEALTPDAPVPSLGNTAAEPRGAPKPVRLPDATAAPARPVAAKAAKRPVSGLPPHELGRVPVVMHHMIRPDRVGEYDQTPAEFRAELELLWRKGYVPVNVGDLVTGDLDVPTGTTPVGFTFDDATTYQLDFTADGRVLPTTAVGIMLDFAKKHPGFVPKGTFYVNRTPFGSRANARRALRWLADNGFEIGNHTHDHVPLRGLGDDEVRKQIATGARVIHEHLPGYEIRTLSLPLGSLPRNEQLAVHGRWQGTAYGPYAVLLVGANPSPSPYSKEFDPAAIPRIRTSHGGWQGEADFSFAYWLQELEQNPDGRYVSDGHPERITVRKGSEADVRARFASRVRARA